MELVATKNGVRYINDTCATIPEATIAALRALNNQPIILIAGGAAKGLSFHKLAKSIVKRVKTLILLKGTATDLLVKNVVKEKLNHDSSLQIFLVDSMATAVDQANDLAVNKDTVLLSPACASFGLFKHEFDRGNQFINLVKT